LIDFILLRIKLLLLTINYLREALFVKYIEETAKGLIKFRAQIFFMFYRF
jgi:hypothetical protein